MKLDFTFFDLDVLMGSISLGDHAEHEGYIAELESLDFCREDQARDAIRKWLLPEFEISRGCTTVGHQRTKLALRVVLSRWGFLPHGPALPGVDDGRSSNKTVQEVFMAQRRFYMWLWDELFHEPFSPLARTDDLLERTDDAFANAPNNPEFWAEPRYRSLEHWDQLIRSDAWRENWPPRLT